MTPRRWLFIVIRPNETGEQENGDNVDWTKIDKK